MSDWKSELDQLVAETLAFTQAIREGLEKSLPQQSEDPAPVPDEQPREFDREFGGPEREEIQKRIEAFASHQLRFHRERAAYAAAVMLKLRQTKDPGEDGTD